VVPVPAGGQDTQLEQIHEMQAKLDEEAGQLVQLRQNIGQEWAGRALAGEARHQAQDVQHRIADDARARLPPASSGVGQNLATAAILLRAMPEPSTTEGRRIQGELKNLLEDVAVRWAESSASRRQGYPPEHRAATSRFMRGVSIHTGRTRDATPAAPGRLGNEHRRHDRRARLDEKMRRGYHPRRGGRYDSGEDRSPSPEPPGPRAFSRAIRRALFPTRFRAPTTITKYSGETRPELWLADYRLACQLGGMDDDNLIIRNLPLFLSDVARAWLEHLPPAQISNWDDLVKAFARNFQGTYVRPGNSWDLRSCRQQPGESLRDYIRRFSKQRTELPNITDSDVIGVFLAGTTCRDLVRKLGRKTPTRASELMDIATKFASGQEAVEAIFWKDKQPQGRQQEDIPEASAQRSAKKKGKKKSQAKRDAADADLVATAEHKNLRKPPGGANLFDKMLKESCPYHQGPVKHTLEECVMFRRYFNKAEPPAEDGKGRDNDKKEGNKAKEFPEVHNCFMIYGGQVANASARHRKQERREVCSVKVAAPVYLDWSDKPITFDQGNHPDRLLSPGKYPLVVDPVIGNVRLTKVLMDGGSILNIIYAKTLELL
jgi:broad specificity phosphatase PhoE